MRSTIAAKVWQYIAIMSSPKDKLFSKLVFLMPTHNKSSKTINTDKKPISTAICVPHGSISFCWSKRTIWRIVVESGLTTQSIMRCFIPSSKWVVARSNIWVKFFINTILLRDRMWIICLIGCVSRLMMISTPSRNTNASNNGKDKRMMLSKAMSRDLNT